MSCSLRNFSVGAPPRRNWSPKGLCSLDPGGDPSRESALCRSLPNMPRGRRHRKLEDYLFCYSVFSTEALGVPYLVVRGGGCRALQGARGPRSLGLWSLGCPRSHSKRKSKERGSGGARAFLRKNQLNLKKRGFVPYLRFLMSATPLYEERAWDLHRGRQGQTRPAI